MGGVFVQEVSSSLNSAFDVAIPILFICEIVDGDRDWLLFSKYFSWLPTKIAVFSGNTAICVLVPRGDVAKGTHLRPWRSCWLPASDWNRCCLSHNHHIQGLGNVNFVGGSRLAGWAFSHHLPARQLQWLSICHCRRPSLSTYIAEVDCCVDSFVIFTYTSPWLICIFVDLNRRLRLKYFLAHMLNQAMLLSGVVLRHFRLVIVSSKHSSYRSININTF